MNKPSIPKGTRDFSPLEMAKRNYIFDTIRSVYALYGFRQIETPAMETLQTLLGKYGDEGDKLLFRVLNSGDFLGKLTDEQLKERNSLSLSAKICEKGLRYDLTVPFARFVVMHRDEIQLPFKRYQIQPVWRADRPQKGRYREFYQLGLELFGSAEGAADAQLISAGYSIIKKLGIEGITLSINSIGCPECRSKYVEALKEYFKLNLDKLCKVCCERLERNPLRLLDCKEVQCKEVKAGAPKITDFLCDSCEQHFEDLKSNLDAMKISYKIDPEIVRGLDYYTGTVFEFLANFDGVETAICGGGRYDNLSETLGGPHLPAVGLGFGVERLLNVMEGRKLSAEPEPKIYVASADKQTSLYAQAVCGDLREAGIIADSDISSRSLKAQLKYASKVGFNYVLILGNDEIQSGEGKIKNMTTGFETKINLKNSISKQFLDILDNDTKNV